MWPFWFLTIKASPIFSTDDVTHRATPSHPALLASDAVGEGVDREQRGVAHEQRGVAREQR